MHVLNMSEKKFKSLKELELHRSIFNTEAQMLVINDKVNWKSQEYILKKLYHDEGTVFSNKLYTINELINKKEEIDIEELVMPEKIVTVHGKIVGFTMPKIDNINFGQVLDSCEFTNEQKIDYLKQIGVILEKMKNVRKYTTVNDFYLNDLHENNFILNKEKGKINVVDMDSCKINKNFAFVSRYLSPISPINEVSKYKKISDFSIGGSFEIDENTDLFCYIVVILNYLFGYKITRISIMEFYDYMSYLHELGASYELIDKLALIYMDKDNENPYEYLDEFKNLVPKCNYKVYDLSRKKTYGVK